MNIYEDPENSKKTKKTVTTNHGPKEFLLRYNRGLQQISSF